MTLDKLDIFLVSIMIFFWTIAVACLGIYYGMENAPEPVRAYNKNYRLSPDKIKLTPTSNEEVKIHSI